MASPSKLAHAVLRTYDVEAMRKWYCVALDARVVAEQLPAMSFITYDDEHHRLGFAGMPGERVERQWQGAGLAHIAFTFPDIRALLQQYERLRDYGSKPGFCVNHGPTVSFYFTDPDGNAIELQIDRLTVAEGTRFMGTPVFQNNPLGVPLDPEFLLQRMHAGATDAELLRYDEDAVVDVAALSTQLMKLVHMI